MRCCVPRAAAPKYQLDPPRLNDVDDPRCVGTYVSQWDSLCTTTRYEDEDCGTTVIETEHVFVYRNIMVLPGKTMNNAICECTVSKAGGDSQASGKWEYSLAMKEEAEQTKKKNEEVVRKLANAAKVAMQWSEALSGRSTGGPAAGGAHKGSSTNFLNSLLDLVEEVNGVEGIEKKAAEGGNRKSDVTAQNLNAAANALLETLNEIKAKGATPNLRSLQEATDSPSNNYEGVVPALSNCSVWRKYCEKSFESLLFDEKCHPMKIIQHGCPREDIEFEALVGLLVT